MLKNSPRKAIEPSKSMKSSPREFSSILSILMVRFGRLLAVRACAVPCFSVRRSWLKVMFLRKPMLGSEVFGNGILSFGPLFSTSMKMNNLSFGPSLYS